MNKKLIILIILILLIIAGGVFWWWQSGKEVTKEIEEKPSVTETIKALQETEKMVQVKDRELIDRVIKAWNAQGGKEGEYYNENANLDGISVDQVIIVSGKIDSMGYHQYPSGDIFDLFFRPYGANGYIYIRFGEIPIIRAKKLIEEGRINEGDEVSVKAKYSGYRASKGDKEIFQVWLSEGSFLNK